jgi:general stress protein YciG
MGGTKDGARKRAAWLRENDPDYFSRIGAMGKKGGRLSPGSFQKDDPRTKAAAAKGGKLSKRPPKKTNKMAL